MGFSSLLVGNNDYNNNSETVNINDIFMNSQKGKSHIDYKPIESSLNISKLNERIGDLSSETGMIGYNLKNDVEEVLNNEISNDNYSQSIVEPFEGILDPYLFIENNIEEPEIRSSYVFPPDDRQKVSSTYIYPWRTICKLYIDAQDGSHYIGSGAIIDNFHVLTCGHCVYIHDSGGWVDEIIVVPGKNGDYEPYCYAYTTYMRTYTGWTQSEMYEHDWAVLTLDRSIGLFTGWMGRQTADPSSSIYTSTLNTAGYPGDLDYGESMYFDSDMGDRADEYNHWYWMDSAGGQSGSPVWRYDGDNRYILSINAYEYIGGTDANFGTRLNSEKFDHINTWLSDDSSSFPIDKPDLLDRDYISGISNNEIVKGETKLDIYCEVKNEGTATASSFNVNFYVSDDLYISSSDYLIGSITINNLEPFNFAVSDWSGVIPIEVPDGSYYVGWIIDPEDIVDEFDENDNIVVLNYPMVEIESPPINFGLIIAIILIIIGSISVIVTITIYITKKIPDLRFDEKDYHLYEERSYSSSELEPLVLNFCPNCAQKLIPHIIFCPNCGYKLI